MTIEPTPEHLPVLRAGDADRERAASIVQGAFAEGRLDLVEFDERIAAVYAGRTVPELEALTVDLVPAAHGSKTDRLVLRSAGSSVKREGQWRVPPRIVVETEHGGVRLDFTEAVLRSPEVWVEMKSAHASVLLIIPPGWSVDIDEVISEWGSVTNKAGAPVSGLPLLRVTGVVQHASVTVRHPRRRRWWWPFG
ncbi:DUF1707 SHOCT-like domain-containing protein [Nocardia flavorosea]|uniref:DUF1707 domain-containing protein n=1 Tax=Nocardia flavorosea TaxID=53429 RepID=A0A846YJQ2_9NOCA|nr:DUF1707 domain-containing protein [Nocardia flavorosea]NKY57348.1 DUF1707 domain-containing protein [Nocardia flavorosea]